METGLILLISLCLLTALLDWRKGLFACVVAALIQDPLRKLVPEEPVYLTLVAAIVLALAIVNALCHGMSLKPRQIAGWCHGLAAPFAFVIVWILLQSLHSLVAYGNPLVTAVGLVVYLAPIPALILSYQFALRSGPNGVENWLRFYVISVGLALTTVVLEYAGVESDLFGQIGEGMKIYDVGTVLIGKTGIFRSTEIAAWHAMAAACFAFIALTSWRMDNKRVALAVAIAASLIAIAVLTGRRKSIIAVAIFATTYLFLLSVFYRNLQNWLLGLMAVGVTLALIVGGMLDPEVEGPSHQATEYQLFLERGKTVFDDAPDRLLNMSLGQTEWATKVTGLLGAGVGVVTSGARHVGTVGKQFGGIGEGGVGKIVAELGFPGLLLIGWFVLALFRHVWHGLKFSAWRSPQIFRLSAGLVAFLTANAMIFVVNTQIFNDFFILIVFGLSLGFLLAMPVLAGRSVAAVQGMADAAKLRAPARP
jgi:hypothetical protein